LSHGAAAVGRGIDLTAKPYNLKIGSRDYFGAAIPNGVGSGYNVGADGAAH
jgi:hypothetical protein